MQTVNVKGLKMPALGLGTWQMSTEQARTAVRDALDLGYRHIDTAQSYENESGVGEGLAESSAKREDVFITTKLWHENLAPKSATRSAENSLDRLGTDYVDLLLIHWPSDEVPVGETLDAMLDLKDDGKVVNIGVSNFPPHELREALDHTDEIVCNQIEYHPYLQQPELLRLHRQNDMITTAYSPLARGQVIEDKKLARIGENHGKSTVQVTLRWLLQQDKVAAVPKANGKRHRKENTEIFDFELDDQEMNRISELNEDERLIDPSFGPIWEH